jgi:hypothetical protein
MRCALAIAPIEPFPRGEATATTRAATRGRRSRHPTPRLALVDDAADAPVAPVAPDEPDGFDDLTVPEQLVAHHFILLDDGIAATEARWRAARSRRRRVELRPATERETAVLAGPRRRRARRGAVRLAVAVATAVMAAAYALAVAA